MKLSLTMRVNADDLGIINDCQCCKRYQQIMMLFQKGEKLKNDAVTTMKDRTQIA